MHPRFALPSAALALIAIVVAVSRARAEALPEKSPFLPPPGAAQAQPTSATEFELVGMTIVGRDRMVSILRLADQRSTWVPVGRTVGEITVVRYDSDRDEALVRVGGRELTLRMRKATVTGGTNDIPAAAGTAARTSSAEVAPTLTVPSKPLTPTEEKEMEARMLVSDLLEIGQQQRKAYEEAQRQAAAKAAAAKKASSPPPATSATQPTSETANSAAPAKK